MSNKILIIVDGSYFSYYVLFAAVRKWQINNQASYDEWIKPLEDTDQDNLPNILNCDEFKKILKQTTLSKLEAIDWILKDKNQEDFDLAERVDFIFARDDDISNSFRKTLYPEYKSQRLLQKKQFQVSKVKNYVLDVLFKEVEAERKYGYHTVQVNGAEGDDVIATAITDLDGYTKKFLIASDHDFLQLDNVIQYDLSGNLIERKVSKNNETTLTPEDYLTYKIILGDSSDNIKQVFQKVGPKKALQLVLNKETLKERLKEDSEAANTFLLNKKLISFSETPKELTESIKKELNTVLYENEVLNNDVFSDIMNI